MLFKQFPTKFLTISSPKLYLNCRLLSGLSLWNEEISSEIKHKIEQHWKDKLRNDVFDETRNKNEKYYVLSMFPYPSGSLHMGHVRVYTISDTIARFQRMNGKNVIHPIGWDAFGLPAENAAIERRIAPNKWTEQNIAHMKSQLKKLNCSFEWHRELATCDPQYYKWTQDLFLKLFEAGLVYQKEAVVNWDPIDQTVLADEQVDENGCSWRSGAKVQKKPLRQWFIRTTKYAKALLEGLDDSVLQDWRDIIKLQKHWIGECNGVSFDFEISHSGKRDKSDFVTLWTPQPEHIRHAKFVAISDKHLLADSDGKMLQDGIRMLDLWVKNPFSGEELPVFVTNKIEFLPFTDSFLGIPAVCDQAAQFASACNIDYEKQDISDLSEPLKKILQDQVCEEARQLKIGGHWTSAKLRDWLISRQRFWGTPIPMIHCDKCGTVPVPRQDLPVKLPDLFKADASLNSEINGLEKKKKSSQLSECQDWVNVRCPKCGGAARRETDTMDTFVDSSWYYLRYLDPRNDREMFDPKKAMSLMPVDLYIGGKEHAVLHLYYARFVSHFLHSLGLLPEREPFKRLLVQGMVMGRSYRVKETGEYLTENKVDIIDLKRNKGATKDGGKPVVITWEKMSKSKRNGVDPDDMFREYGIDTTRLLILADVAPTSHRNWNSNTFPGILNWQKRLWLTVGNFIRHRNDPPPLPTSVPEDRFEAHDDYMFDSRNYYLKGATFNYCGSQQHSVAISKQQGLTNSLRGCVTKFCWPTLKTFPSKNTIRLDTAVKSTLGVQYIEKVPPVIYAHSPQFERALATQIILLAPMAPCFASELWSGFVSAPNRLNNTGEIQWDKTVLEQKWPQIDQHYNLDLVCEVNGEEICVVKIPRSEIEVLSKEEAIDVVMKQEQVQTELSTRTVLGMEYVLHGGYEGVVTIRTNRVQKPKKEKKTAKN